MAYIEKRKFKSGKTSKLYYIWYKDATGTPRCKSGFADRTTTEALATRLETEAKLVREGLIAPAEMSRREASRRTLADHIEDYRRHLIAKGGTARHAGHVAKVLTRLLDDANVKSLAHLTPDRIHGALGRLRVVRSPRTCNHARGAAKAFATWLVDNDRIDGHKLKTLATFSEEIDRKRERRSLTLAEVARLIAAAETGPTLRRADPSTNPGRRSPRGGSGAKGRGRKYLVTGPERAMLYRLAVETGLRAEEIRSLTRESFRLDQVPPLVVVPAAYTKNGKLAEQPIRPEFAADLRAWLESRPPDTPIVPVVERTAQLLRVDLAAAGIPYKDARGLVCDFHALRGTYGTLLMKGGADIKTVQSLMRHSTPTLTMNAYMKSDDSDKAKALEGLKGDKD